MRRVWLACVAVGILTLPPVTVQAAVTFIDSDYTTQTQGVGGNTLTLTVTAAAGDAICACGLHDSQLVDVTISDDDGSTYTHLAPAAIGTIEVRMACALNIAAPSAGDVVVTADWGVAAYRGLFVQVFRGVATMSAIEDSDSATGTATNPATPALTLAGTGIVSACAQYETPLSITPTAPLISDQEDESYTSVAGAMSYGPYSGSGFTPSWSLGGVGANWGAQAIALLELAAVSSTRRCLLLGVGSC